MTRSSLGTLGLVATAVAGLSLMSAAPAQAQCCGAPTVAYSPVVVQPQTTVVRTGWYPGYLLDRMRLRRWSAADTTLAAAPAYSVGYAPTYPASYAPTYTASYAPAYTASYAPATYTAGYTPYITAYAPLQSAVVQTSYAAPVVSGGCSSCAQSTTVSYAPSTVYRPVEVAPVIAAPACSACAVEAPCSACSAGVSQVSYVEGAPATSSCANCAAEAGTPVYNSGPPAPPASSQSGPATPQPELSGAVPEPADRSYGTQRPTANDGATGTSEAEKSVVPGPAPEDDAAGPEADPAASTDSKTSYDLEAPPLLGPQNDRTANRPTVDIHNAVYRQPARQATRVSTTAAKAALPDANGWESVRDRE
jgi:hypothetical protein